MAAKPGRWCNRCKGVHAGKCPEAPVWVKPVFKRSGRGGRPWQRKRQRVFERDGYLCQMHLRKGVEVVVTLHGVLGGVCDHVVPLADGGSDYESNLQTICKACDKQKTHAESLRGRGGSKP
jgi:5-methylcytosine-specific restriction enzyme A